MSGQTLKGVSLPQRSHIAHSGMPVLCQNDYLFPIWNLLTFGSIVTVQRPLISQSV